MRLLPVVFALVTFLSSAFCESVTFTTATTIGCGNTTYENYDVTVNGVQLTVACAHSFNSLRLINGATLTHPAGDTVGVYLTVAHNVLVDTTSHINVVGRGYGPNVGPGAGGTTDAYGSGGGYGGTGGISTQVATGGGSYGSAGTPLMLGSGGGASGGFGGGIIHLVAGDTLQVTGGLWANGGSCSNTAGAGAGGSICVTTGVLTGHGQITATGGGAQSTGGGGGGGRIALYYTQSNFTGTLSVCGGTGYQYGGAGTIFTKAASQSVGDLQVFNCTLMSVNTTPLANLPACNLTLTSYANAVWGDSILTIAGNLRVTVTTQLVTRAGQASLLHVQGKAVIDSGGIVSAVGKGYAAGTGQGAGFTNVTTGGGGGYGGYGGAGNVAQGGVTYGSIDQPLALGSGGGGVFGSAGGGALHVIVNDSLVVNGTLSVNGDVAGSLSGGGSGGSLYLEVTTLAGRGSITAQGGQAGNNGGGGGGGRLALYYTTNSFTGTLSCCGGWGYKYGGAGTLYKLGLGQPTADLTINNCAHSGANTGLVNTPPCNISISSGGAGEFTDSVMTIAGNVHVYGTSSLWIKAGRPLTLTVNGNLAIDTLGSFSALGKGYSPGTGPGAGQTYGTYGGGGGHGGIGGTGTGGAQGGGTYGTTSYPLLMGSGGGASAGAAGGGALKLTVRDTLFVKGVLTTNGGESGAFGGGGSGGSLLVVAHTISGNGTITSDGGNGNVGGGGGGGGRIALYTCGQTVPTSHIHANGGDSQHPGSVGTVFLPTADCNSNGVPDGCDIASGTSTDFNNNGIPDECENLSTAILTIYFAADNRLMLYWTAIPGYPHYRVLAQHHNDPEVELTVTPNLSYDATDLLGTALYDYWRFRIVGTTE
jgi:hypothetical protein